MLYTWKRFRELTPSLAKLIRVFKHRRSARWGFREFPRFQVTWSLELHINSRLCLLELNNRLRSLRVYLRRKHLRLELVEHLLRRRVQDVGHRADHLQPQLNKFNSNRLRLANLSRLSQEWQRLLRRDHVLEQPRDHLRTQEVNQVHLYELHLRSNPKPP